MEEGGEFFKPKMKKEFSEPNIEKEEDSGLDL